MLKDNLFVMPKSWDYKVDVVNGYVEKLTLMRNNVPYWIFTPKQSNDAHETIKHTMKELFDLSSGIVEELPTTEIAYFLATIQDITCHMKTLLIKA